MDKEEIWYDIPGYERYYQFSSLDRIKSLERLVIHSDGRRNIYKSRILKQQISKGHLHICLSKNNIHKTWRIHHIKALILLPNPNNYPMVGHKDNNGFNNDIDNLFWCNNQQNVQQAWDDGLCEETRKINRIKITGEKAPWYKLTEVEVLEIRRLYATGDWTMEALCKRFNLKSPASIHFIIHKKQWTHL